MRIEYDDTFAPRTGGQSAFWDDWENRLLFLEGGWGSGKTWIGARKLLAGVIHNAIEPDADDPTIGHLTRIDGAMIGPTYRSMADFMFPAFEEACDDWGISYKWSAKDNWYRLTDLGCKVRARTADRPDLITGWQVATAWGDEPSRWKEDRTDPKQDPFLQLLGRVRGRGRLHQVYFTYTNEGDHTRVYEEAHSSSPGRARYRARTKDNPAVEDFYNFQRQTLTPALAEQYLEGGAAQIGGTLAYAEQYDVNLHVTPRALTIPSQPLAMTVDFNIEPGMHIYLGHYLQDTDLFVVVHEIHGPRMSARQAIVEFGNWIGRQGGFVWPELIVYGDATGRSESPATGESSYDVLAQAIRHLGVDRISWDIPKANPPKIDRVNAMNIALRDIAGTSHVAINPQCERLLYDLPRVRWTDDGKNLDQRNPVLTHPTDAIGYWVHRLRPVRRYIEGTAGRVSV